MAGSANAVNPENVDRLRAALNRISRRLDRQISTGGLTSTQLSVLTSVTAHGPLGLGELAELERINPTMLSRIVGKLEEDGLIQRQVDQVDRRVVRVEVTTSGARLRHRLLAERSKALAERLTSLPAEVAETLVAA